MNNVCYIAGIGAFGSLIAGYFSHAGIETRLILKNSDSLANYEQYGLEIISPDETFKVHPQAHDVQQLQGNIDLLIVCVKAFDVTNLLLSLKKHLSENSLIILQHNGLGVLEEIDKALPTLRVISGVSTLGAHKLQAFKVKVFLSGNLHFGPVRGQFTPREISNFCHILDDSKLPYTWDEQINFRLWEKFAINCSINLLTVLFNCRNKNLLQHESLLDTLTFEISKVLKAHAVEMPHESLLRTVKKVIVGTGENYSSMHQDAHHHRQTELKYLNEYLVELGRQVNVLTPVNDELIVKFKSMV